MSKQLNLLNVMSADNVYKTLNEAVNNGKCYLSMKTVDDPDTYTRYCLLLEWPVDSDQLEGFSGVFVESMEIAIACKLINKGLSPKFAIHEILSADFYCSPECSVPLTPMLIPDGSYYPFSTESLKPILDQLLPKLVVKVNKHEATLYFDNNPRILDEKLRLDKSAVQATNDFLCTYYDLELSDEENLASLKKFLIAADGIVLPENYYIDQHLEGMVVTHRFNVMAEESE